jgi:hypothetical protein
MDRDTPCMFTLQGCQQKRRVNNSIYRIWVRICNWQHQLGQQQKESASSSRNTRNITYISNISRDICKPKVLAIEGMSATADILGTS